MRPCSSRSVVKGVMDAEKWAGYEGQAFASDQTAAGIVDLNDKIAALTPDGTSWYRIRTQAGTWTGVVVGSSGDFGTGGLLIEPDTGHEDVVMNFRITNFYTRKVHWRNCVMVPPRTDAENGMFFNYISSPHHTIQMFTGNRIGEYYGDDYDLAYALVWGTFYRTEFMEQIIIDENVIDGVGNFVSITGGRMISLRDNDVKYMVRDFCAVSPAYRFDTPRGVFADDGMYVSIVGSTIRKNPDIVQGLEGASRRTETLAV